MVECKIVPLLLDHVEDTFSDGRTFEGGKLARSMWGGMTFCKYVSSCHYQNNNVYVFMNIIYVRVCCNVTYPNTASYVSNCVTKVHVHPPACYDHDDLHDGIATFSFKQHM